MTNLEKQRAKTYKYLLYKLIIKTENMLDKAIKSLK